MYELLNEMITKGDENDAKRWSVVIWWMANAMNHTPHMPIIPINIMHCFI